MAVLSSSAYNTAEDVLTRLRTICNDSEIQGGDVITDTAPFAFDLLNSGFERVQVELAKYGVETYTDEVWLIGLPTMPTVDPAGRMIIADTGISIIYPNGVGNSFQNSPALPLNLVYPLRLKERQTNTVNFPDKMRQPNGGLLNIEQQLYLIDWEYKSDGIHTRGAMQSQDLWIEYEKQLAKLAAPTDPVPIRGVVNAAAYFAACVFAAGRGGAILPRFEKEAEAEIFNLQALSVRRRSRKQVRRRPYSGRGGRNYQGLS